MSPQSLFCGLTVLCFQMFPWLPDTVVSADEPDAAQLEFFESSVRPLLIAHCYKCHSQDAVASNALRGGLLLDSRSGVLAGGDSGPALVAGKPDESLLIHSVLYTNENLQMPPDGRLQDEQIAILQKWVEMGAPDPRTSAPAGTKPTKPGMDLDAARSQWAFRKPQRAAAPQVQNSEWPQQELDYFVLAAMEQRGLHPVRTATRQELIRRATFDLLGLPPTPEEIEAFENDTQPGAWDRVIDRLLASPHYGERWGRYWLDVARYADDQGNSFLTPTPTAYLYRDWVVQAFNQDMPYDEFLRLQIAGDEIPGPADNYVTRLAGLGFQSLGPQFRKGAAGEARAKADELEDRVDTLSRGILGLTVSCARCHDHKFDPIPTRDYYSLAAAYNGVEWPMQMLASPEAIEKHQQWNASMEQQTAALKAFRESQVSLTGKAALQKIDAYASAAVRMLVLRKHNLPLDEQQFATHEGLELYFLRRWVAVLEKPGDEPVLRDLRTLATAAVTSASVAVSPELQQQGTALKSVVVEALSALDASQRPANDAANPPVPLAPEREQLLKSLWKTNEAPFFVEDAELPGLLAEPAKTQLADLQNSLENLRKNPALPGPLMPGIRGGGQAMRVFVRGNPEQPGEPAPPGFLRILSPPDTKSDAATFSRLQLAQAVTSPDNPLTARVFVNRVWLYHFGRGIVSTPGNFGKLGSPPTHPELLDTLAAQFMESGWSIKSLHRRILQSATWQLSSLQDPENMTLDPANEFLWRMSPRRLDVEAWRDALLSVAGTLDPAIGGASVEQTNPGVKEVEGFNFFTRLNGFEADNPQGRRRTLYSVISRYTPNATLTLFDFPEPNVTSDQRTATMVPQQQLFVLNSPFMMEVSRQFAKRLQAIPGENSQRLMTAWKLAYGRPPSEEELKVAEEFLLATAESGGLQDPLTPWEQLAHSLLASNEFFFVP
jgi:cytochrome c553